MQRAQRARTCTHSSDTSQDNSLSPFNQFFCSTTQAGRAKFDSASPKVAPFNRSSFSSSAHKFPVLVIYSHLTRGGSNFWLLVGWLDDKNERRGADAKRLKDTTNLVESSAAILGCVCVVHTERTQRERETHRNSQQRTQTDTQRELASDAHSRSAGPVVEESNA